MEREVAAREGVGGREDEEKEEDEEDVALGACATK